VAQLSTKAEYISLNKTTREVVWLRSLLSSLNFTQVSSTVIYEDNQPAIDFSKNPGDHRRTKHIEVHYHFICKKAHDVIRVEHCPINQQMADIMTKTSKAELFTATREAILHPF
jgi:Fe2+ or Zn2+ uptake regulation protein